MVRARKPRKTTAKPLVVNAAAAAELKLFHDGGGRHPDFSFTRAYWGDGSSRESIAERIDRKINLKSASGLSLGRASRVDLLLPPDAPQDHTDPDHLIKRYEATLPAYEPNAFVQVTVRFPGASNLHQPWEMVRQWARQFYAGRVPVLMVLHAPHLSGSGNPGHVHCIVLPRRLGSLGWTEIERGLACDAGQREAYESWSAFAEQWEQAN